MADVAALPVTPPPSQSAQPTEAEAEQLSRLRTLYETNAKRTRIMFENDTDAFLHSQHVKGTKDSLNISVLHAINSQYAAVKHIPPPAPVKPKQPATAAAAAGGDVQQRGRRAVVSIEDDSEPDATTIINDALINSSRPAPPPATANGASATSSALTLYQPPSSSLPCRYVCYGSAAASADRRLWPGNTRLHCTSVAC